MMIIHLGRRFIEALIITWTHVGENVYIPRIIMSPTELAWPFLIKQRQYPIPVCIAMTTNKSQGQSLTKVGLYLPKQFFHTWTTICSILKSDKKGQVLGNGQCSRYQRWWCCQEHGVQRNSLKVRQSYIFFVYIYLNNFSHIANYMQHSQEWQ
jgi:hypothetical protein